MFCSDIGPKKVRNGDVWLFWNYEWYIVMIHLCNEFNVLFCVIKRVHFVLSFDRGRIY